MWWMKDIKGVTNKEVVGSNPTNKKIYTIYTNICDLKKLFTPNDGWLIVTNNPINITAWQYHDFLSADSRKSLCG